MLFGNLGKSWIGVDMYRFILYLLLDINVYMRCAMKQATFSELRNHAKQYFDLVESGESVRIVRNGKPIADIVPIAHDLPSWKRRSVQPLVLDGVSLSRMILEERETGL